MFKLPSFIICATLMLTACHTTSQQVAFKPHVQQAVMVEALTDYERSTVMIEDLLGVQYSILGDVNDHAIAWKEQESGLIAFVEYKDGCIKRAYLTDADGNIISAEKDYKRCEV